MTQISLTTPIQLSDWRDQELADLFATLPVGAAPSGHLHGKLFAVHGLTFLPRPLARGLYALLSTPLNPWRGKSFSNDKGSNHLLWLNGPALGHYHISQQTGADGQHSLWLDYNVERNPALLRRIRGEARQLRKDQWLCRMLWQTDRGQTTLLWFTLQGE
ncbi:hypothetical protein [Alcanivorax sp. 1008]|uniref:hypothetical protein n=1 Tax=Alcanivorax sp. 1008 TaxID=2816853 RepID=UPI001D9AD041|nr:hypothetical protein [Alcanivorax sp. 1008]MCC1496653.1 hypothetical protein [Alcanivorax sp. 1008]